MSVDESGFTALLADLEGALRAAGDPIVDAFRPGLTRGEIDSLTARLGLSLPVEARLWWSWYDGVQEPGPELFRIGVPLPLSTAVDEYFRQRDDYAVEAAEIMQEAGADRPRSFYWEDTWLPMFSPGRAGAIAVDTDVPHGEAAPILDTELDPEGVFRTPFAASLAEILQAWLTMIERGLCRWDNALQVWRYTVDWSELPQDLRRRIR